MAWVAVGSAAVGAIGSAYAGKKAAKAGSATTQQQLDPRAEAIIYGDGNTGQHGLLTQYQQLGQAPQNKGLMDFGQGNLNYLSTAPGDMLAMREAGLGLMKGNQAPQIGNAAWAVGNMVNAPKQNDIDLSRAYNDFINGPRGDNPFLTKAVQGGIDQSKNMFGQMQSQATENLQENILPGIRSASVLSGQYGGSRQGIAEGNAIGDHAKAMQQAATQFGQNNTNAAVGAQANAYETDSNRALSATQGLGAQQYGVAQQDAATKNAAEFMNVGQVLDISKNNAQLQLQGNAQNQNGALAGSGLLSGQLGTAYGVGQNHDNFGINRAGQVNGLLAPYLSQGGSQTSTQPIHQNTAGSMFGGAMAGLGLYNQFKSPYSGIGSNDGMGTGNNYNYTPTPQSTNPGLLQNLGFFGG